MKEFANEFEEAIANVPYSSYWFDMRNKVVQIIMDVYYEKMSYFRIFQSTPTDDPDRKRSMVFEIFGQLYMYNEHFENGLIESGQLDKIIHLSSDWNDCVSVVLYSNVANASPCAGAALKFFKSVGMHKIFEHLNKGSL